MKKHKIKSITLTLLALFMISSTTLFAAEPVVFTDEAFKKNVQLNFGEDYDITEHDLLTVNHMETDYIYQVDFEGYKFEVIQMEDAIDFAKLPKLNVLSFNVDYNNPILPKNLSALNTGELEQVMLGSNQYLYSVDYDLDNVDMDKVTSIFREFLDVLSGQEISNLMIEDSRIDKYDWLLGLDLTGITSYLYNGRFEMIEKRFIPLNYTFSHSDDEHTYYKFELDTPLETSIKLTEDNVIVEDVKKENTFLHSFVIHGTYPKSITYYDYEGNIIDTEQDYFDNSGVAKISFTLSEEDIAMIQETYDQNLNWINETIEETKIEIENIKQLIEETADPNDLDNLEYDLRQQESQLARFQRNLEMLGKDLIDMEIEQYSQSDDSELSLTNLFHFSLGEEFGANHTVTFDTKGGTPNVDSQTVQNNKKVTVPNEITKEGYTFNKWVTKADEDWNFDTDLVVDDMTLYATWTPKTFTITYDSHEGSAVNKQTVEYNKTFTEPLTPTKTDYTFKGWYTEDTFTSLYSFDTLATKDITVHAKWEKKDKEEPNIDVPEPTNPKTPDPKEPPKTGINSNYTYYLLLIGVASALMITLSSLSRKKRKQ